MISSGAMILIDESGKSKVIESLEVGDQVICSMMGAVGCVSSVERHVVSVEGAKIFQTAVSPLVIEKHALSSIAPDKDIIVSSQQEIMVAVDDKASKYKVVNNVQASALNGFGFQTALVEKGQVIFFKVELERGSHIIADNVICKVSKTESMLPSALAVGVRK